MPEGRAYQNDYVILKACATLQSVGPRIMLA
jgi:hypothetical protein